MLIKFKLLSLIDNYDSINKNYLTFLLIFIVLDLF